MPTTNFAFSGGQAAVPGYGDRWQALFGGSWALSFPPEYWSLAITSSEGDFTLGVGNLHALVATVCLTFKDRVFAGMGSQYNFCDNGDPTGWEEQNPGAGFFQFLSQYGGQDTINSFGVTQGRLMVIGRRSVQIWQVDGDPANFSLIQVLDNIGTLAPAVALQLGDMDVLVLYDTGVRSLKTKEVTLSAYVDDVGSPIDDFIQTALAGLSSSISGAACGIVEPKTGNAWIHLNGTIYVLSRHPGAKITAWSTYEPRGNDNVLFTPQKFVVFNGVVYCRAAEGGHYVYGGATNSTYDQYATVTWQIPWLDDKRPGTNKVFTGMSAVMAGKWIIDMSTDPVSDTFSEIINKGNAAAPFVLTDSTYDQNRYPIDMQGTHFSIIGSSANTSATTPAVFSSLVLYYNTADVQ